MVDLIFPGVSYFLMVNQSLNRTIHRDTIADADDYFERGRFSGTVDAEQSEALPFAYTQRQVIHGQSCGSFVNLPFPNE